MSEDESVHAHFGEYVQDVVASGYWDEPLVLAFLGETIEYELGPEGEAEFLAQARRLLRERFAEEARWTTPTANDALDQAFAVLKSRGIVALQNAGLNVEQGWARIEEEAGLLGPSVRGVAFFSEEDVHHAVRGEALRMTARAPGARADSPESSRVRQEVRACLVDHGLASRDEGAPDSIQLAPFAWRKRRWTHVERVGAGGVLVRPNDAPWRFAPVLRAASQELGFPAEAVVGALEDYIAARVRQQYGAWLELDLAYEPARDRVKVCQVLSVVERLDPPPASSNQRTLAELQAQGFDVSVEDELLVELFYQLADAEAARRQDKKWGVLQRLLTFGFSIPAPSDELLRAELLARLRS
ncbi:hypothetical protein [Myxococcus sp. AB056]|uniref:DUF6891 domain-containing protein n=1 Tax=Myxococcus sp. AB056 TaxID=2562792 RepID=UPI001E2EA1AD|nr:hypothetical protein [Myxococcus sp. AB056]